MRREIIEITVFVILLGSYVYFNRFIAEKAHFIIPTILLCLTYILFLVKTKPGFLKECGIRSDNLKQAAKLMLLFLIPAIVVIVLLSLSMKRLSWSSSFLYLLCLYPVWGITQQFLFQSFFHTRLITLRLAPWSILIVAAIFSLVHLPDVRFVVFTFIWGGISSFIFLRTPNIFPLGIAHGILGALFYYMLLDNDVLRIFIGSIENFF